METACSTCGGGGAVPPSSCTCTGPGHVCVPVLCPSCEGSGQQAFPVISRGQIDVEVAADVRWLLKGGQR